MSIATYHTVSAVRVPARRRPSLLSRLFARLIDARQRQALRELKRHGVMLPSELEQAGWKLNERSEDSLPFIGR